ncbi:MAG: hypothetical protein ACREDF_10520 [Thermoplasmata archaeon]
MAVLPDLVAAGWYGLVVFLVVLGFLVVFVETVPPRRLVGVLLGTSFVAIVLVSIGEAGMVLLALGFGGALIANQTFEWLTTR